VFVRYSNHVSVRGFWAKKEGHGKTGPFKCEGQKPPEGNSCCGGTGRKKTTICISWIGYGKRGCAIQPAAPRKIATFGMYLKSRQKKRATRKLGPFIVMKVIKPPEGNSCCGGTGRKKATKMHQLQSV
jgi:hypothetical protein